MSRIHSMAQPSPSGSSSSLRPGKNWATSFAVSLCRRYSILGPYPGGSETTSFSSGIDRSTMVLAMAEVYVILGPYGAVRIRAPTHRSDTNAEPPLSLPGHPRRRRTHRSDTKESIMTLLESLTIDLG